MAQVFIIVKENRIKHDFCGHTELYKNTQF